ncbi:MAG: NAD(P)-dependent oxidoreductase [Solirubrobacteraceae bacterium]
MRIAIFGAGTMGAPMAENLAAAGHDVVVWNRTPQKVRGLAGVRAAAERSEAVAGCDALLTILSDGDAVTASVDGVLAAVPLWIQMSTIGVEGTERCAELAEQAGATFVDAPVLGTKAPAEQGQLIVLASGPQQVQERCAPVFDAVGRRTLWVGEAGSGTRLKLVTNTWILALVEGIAETFKLAQGLDIDPARFLEAIDSGPLDAGYVKVKGQAIMDGTWDASFALRLARKDADLVGAAAARCDLELPLIRTVAERLARAVDEGYGDDDLIATYRTL